MYIKCIIMNGYFNDGFVIKENMLFVVVNVVFLYLVV